MDENSEIVSVTPIMRGKGRNLNIGSLLNHRLDDADEESVKI